VSNRIGRIPPKTILGYRKNGKPIYPIAGGSSAEDEATAAAEAAAKQEADAKAAAEAKAKEDAEKDWKVEAEKWKALSRKHEDTAKANAAAKAKLDEIEKEKLSTEERLTKERDEMLAELTKFKAREVQVAAALAAKLPAELHEFVTAADPEAAKAQAEKLASTLKPTGAGGTGAPPQGYQGARGASTPSLDSGRELYEASKKK
jgi:alanyl-tRNA synthetase